MEKREKEIVTYNVSAISEAYSMACRELFLLALSLTDWSWLLDIICSVALPLMVDIVSPAVTWRLQQTYLRCLSLCPSVRRVSPEDAPSQ